MNVSRRSILAAAWSMPFAAAMPAALRGEAMLQAAQETEVPPLHPVYTRDGLALAGYDPVAYFTEGAARPGRPEHRLKWHGALWQFASDENCLAFEMSPMRFKPQYGGYCAYTVAHGTPMKSDPEAWTIHDGKLYMNFNPSLRILWRRDIPGHIAMAEAEWARLRRG